MINSRGSLGGRGGNCSLRYLTELAMASFYLKDL